MRREREREEKNGLFVFIVVLIALYTYLPGKFKVCSKVNFATHTALKSPKNVSCCVAFFLKLTNAPLILLPSLVYTYLQERENCWGSENVLGRNG